MCLLVTRRRPRSLGGRCGRGRARARARWRTHHHGSWGGRPAPQRAAGCVASEGVSHHLRRQSPQEAFSRIKKDLIKEVKALRPGDRVLVVGNSREPWLAAKKDEKAFLGFWSKALHLPLPDYASRRVRARGV